MNRETKKMVDQVSTSNPKLKTVSKDSKSQDLSSKDYRYSDNNSFDLGFSYKEYFKNELKNLKHDFIDNVPLDQKGMDTMSPKMPGNLENAEIQSQMQEQRVDWEVQLAKQSRSFHRENDVARRSRDLMISKDFLSFKKKSQLQSGLVNSLLKNSVEGKFDNMKSFKIKDHGPLDIYQQLDPNMNVAKTPLKGQSELSSNMRGKREDLVNQRHNEGTPLDIFDNSKSKHGSHQKYGYSEKEKLYQHQNVYLENKLFDPEKYELPKENNQHDDKIEVYGGIFGKSLKEKLFEENEPFKISEVNSSFEVSKEEKELHGRLGKAVSSLSKGIISDTHSARFQRDNPGQRKLESLRMTGRSKDREEKIFHQFGNPGKQGHSEKDMAESLRKSERSRRPKDIRGGLTGRIEGNIRGERGWQDDRGKVALVSNTEGDFLSNLKSEETSKNADADSMFYGSKYGYRERDMKRNEGYYTGKINSKDYSLSRDRVKFKKDSV